MGKRQNKVRFYLITSLSIFFLPFCRSLQSPLFLVQTITSLFFCTVRVRHTRMTQFLMDCVTWRSKKTWLSVYACFVTADTPMRASGCSTQGFPAFSNTRTWSVSNSQFLWAVVCAYREGGCVWVVGDITHFPVAFTLWVHLCLTFHLRLTGLLL